MHLDADVHNFLFWTPKKMSSGTFSKKKVVDALF